MRRRLVLVVVIGSLLAGCLATDDPTEAEADMASQPADVGTNPANVTLTDETTAFLLKGPFPAGAKATVTIVSLTPMSDARRTHLVLGMATPSQGLANFTGANDAANPRPLVSMRAFDQEAEVGEQPNFRDLINGLPGGDLVGSIPRLGEHTFDLHGREVAIMLAAAGQTASMSVELHPESLWEDAVHVQAIDPPIRFWSSLEPDEVPDRTEVHVVGTGILQLKKSFEVTSSLSYVRAWTSGTQGELRIEIPTGGACRHENRLPLPVSMGASVINGGRGEYIVSVTSAAPLTLGGNYVDIMVVEVPFWSELPEPFCIT